jgi:hypothetical protein
MKSSYALSISLKQICRVTDDTAASADKAANNPQAPCLLPKSQLEKTQ